MLTGITVASAPASTAATLSGPTSAGVSTQVTYTIPSGNVGLYQIVDTNNQVWATAQDNLLGGSPVYLTFTTPNFATTLNLIGEYSSDGGNTWSVVGTTQLVVGGLGTTTTISAPNTATIGVATQITVTVTSSGGSSYQPLGQVVVKDANGATVTTMGLTPGPGAGQSYAYWRWTPPAAGTFIFIATYLPAQGAQATGSTSVQDAIIATPSGSTIAIKHPPIMYAGVPTTLTANVFPASVQGSVGFTVNGQPISGSIPIVNGSASMTWTPPAAGTITLGASYTTNQGGSGSTSEQITIQPASQTDAISLVQPGWGPWAPGGTYTLGNGSTFTFQASTLSGAPVTLSETGPCQVSGLTITVPVGSGACNLKASSPGGNGYAPTTAGYTVNLIPGTQQANITAPQSGRYKVGRVLVLESPGQADTSGGQNINWNVQKGGKAVCKLLYPDNGSVTLRIAKKGQCTVVGKAPGVPGQWQPFSVTRTYIGR